MPDTLSKQKQPANTPNTAKRKRGADDTPQHPPKKSQREKRKKSPDQSQQKKRAKSAQSVPGGANADESAAVGLLNIKFHQAADGGGVAEGAGRPAVFLFAHGAGGKHPRSENKESMRYVRLLQKVYATCLPMILILYVSL